jgi:transposase-like protein
MFILSQLQTYNSEEYCKEDFRRQREQQGVQCKRCNSKEHYWLSSKSQWECKKCKFRTTLKSGTMMEHSKMTFRKWYQVMIMMSATKKGISAKEMQRQFGATRYESTWNLMHKIRQAMGNREASYKLDDQIELDEAYYRVETLAAKKANQKRGRGSVITVPVSIMVESTRLENIETNETTTRCGHLKMKLIEDHKAETIDEVVKGNAEKNAILFSDDSTSYTHLEEIAEEHHPTKSSEQTTKTELKWVHTVISNSKRVFNGIHHKVNKKYIQNYLNEFSYKFNRRYFKDKLFDRVLLAVAMSTVSSVA